MVAEVHIHPIVPKIDIIYLTADFQGILPCDKFHLKNEKMYNF